MSDKVQNNSGQSKSFTVKTDIRDVKGPIDFPISLWPLILLVIVLILMMIYAVTRGTMNYLRKRDEEIHNRTPYQLALERLEILKKKDFIRTGRYNELFTGLSLVIRHYVEDRFEINAPEMTTEEFLGSLKSSKKLDVTQKGLLKDFLLLCDMVKFAQYGPATHEIGSAFDAALKFVEETKPVEEI